MVAAGQAATTITAPGDLDVRGHGPEADALMNHYALENSTPFQLLILRGFCSGGNTCLGGADAGDACTTNADCDGGPLTFLSGETEWFDANGNTVAGPIAFTAADFDAGASLNNVGICNADPTVQCTGPGDDDEDSCGAGDPACNARPSAGYVPDHAILLVRNPKEIVLHNLVPAEAEIRICFNEFNGGGGCDELIVRQSLLEYTVPPGQTYIYPLGVPSTAGEVITNGEAHEYFSHHRGVNNQRHAYDVLSTIGGDFVVGSVCDSGECDGGARDGDTCTDNGDCLDNLDYFIYNEPVLAMADGTVVSISKNFAENPNPPDKLAGIGASSTCEVAACPSVPSCLAGEVPIVGNSVFIEHANGEISMAAHLIPGSNNHLNCGDSVSQGDTLGMVGNSGNSTAPHLHYSTDVLPDFWDGNNYSLPSYYTNAAFAFGPDPTVRRQLDVSLHSESTLEIWSLVGILPPNAPLATGAVNESEANDTLATHNLLTLPTVVTGTIENQDVGDLAVRGDGIEDIFRFDLLSADEIRIVLDGADAAENLDIYALTADLRVLNETGQGTSQGSFEELCLNLDAGTYYLTATNVDLTQDKDESYTLDVSSDPQTISAEITNTEQPVEVDGSCEATITFEIEIHDNCCLNVDDLGLKVTADNPTNNLTLGTVVIDSTVADDSRNVTVTGHVDVSDVESCPASVTIEAEAKDCSGNVVDTETQDSGDAVDVIDATPPEVTSSNDDLFCLWPPNHAYVCFEADQFEPEIADNCDATPTWEFDACTSDQPDNGIGDGDTVNDCVVDAGAQDFCARSERMGNVKAGRRYDLDITASDVCGNVSDATEMGNILAPHNASKGMMCVAPPI